MKLMVLNDGETFAGLTGSKIIEVPDEWDTNDVELALAEDDDDGAINLAELKVIQTF
jgi:hypothetical protein